MRQISERPHVFVADLDAPELDAADFHHLDRVLRLRPDDAVTASDGAGRLRPCRLEGGGILRPEGEAVEVPPACPSLTVAFAVTKGTRPEWATQKLTELGIDRIVAFTADRSVARWGPERAAGHVARLRRVAREAAMQSRRAHLPVVDDLSTFSAVTALPGAALAERGGGPPTLDRPVLVIGPEGGWAPSERACGLPVVGLGPEVLRAETAALAAGALLAGLRSGLVAARRSP